ncbi:glyoxylate/hydroxypyruvate reductase HPR3-like [Benincasa hispida]|uniref:glyoxylate/hydroxypyruvate reductase HPR3-like n=1 Tax=Benincasa hispida TaxID=102211 RepID=UPI001901CFBA|nr:glyoxylate/hydroxypyruvate reductase HPR3-like [Benincasa hispida]
MEESEGDSKKLPEVLVLGSPWLFPALESQFSSRFHFLRPSLSDLPLLQFLSSYAQSIQALLIPGGFLITSAVLHCLPALKLVVTTSAGVDHLDLPELRRRQIAIAYVADLYSEDVADFAVGLLIDVLMKVSAGDRFLRLGFPSTKGDFPSLRSKLSGKRIGIVGLGQIGSKVAKRLEGFECKISYNSRTKKPLVPYSYYSNVYELASNCDGLVICCGITKETRHMINKEVMVALGKDGVIINIGRGAIIDEKAMVECLIKGEIGGVGLDVFENEPEIPEELFSLDNVVLSPHVAVMTHETLVDLSKLVVDNLEAFFSNKPLVSLFPN